LTPYTSGILTGLCIAVTVAFAVASFRRPRSKGDLIAETPGARLQRYGRGLLYLTLLTHSVARMLVEHHVFYMASDAMWGIKVVVMLASVVSFSYGSVIRRREIAQSTPLLLSDVSGASGD